MRQSPSRPRTGFAAAKADHGGKPPDTQARQEESNGGPDHAYGDGPSQLRRLLSDDEDERMDAILGYLLSSVFHQYSIYPATPYAMVSVIRILESGEINALESGMGDSMASQLLHFVRSCAERGQSAIEGKPDPFAPTIEEAAASGRQIYERMTEDACPKVRAEAAALLALIGNNQKSEQGVGGQPATPPRVGD